MTTSNPLPPVQRRKYSYGALKNLEVGESVTYPLECWDSIGPAMQRRWRLEHKKFVRRTEVELIRVWRVS